MLVACASLGSGRYVAPTEVAATCPLAVRTSPLFTAFPAVGANGRIEERTRVKRLQRSLLDDVDQLERRSRRPCPSAPRIVPLRLHESSGVLRVHANRSCRAKPTPRLLVAVRSAAPKLTGPARKLRLRLISMSRSSKRFLLRSPLIRLAGAVHAVAQSSQISSISDRSGKLAHARVNRSFADLPVAE